MITMTTKRGVFGKNVAAELALQKVKAWQKKLRRWPKASYGVGVVLALCLALPAYAQEQKVIITTNQQYQNMAHNASFESWPAGTTAIPDAWTGVNSPAYLKLTNDKMVGASSIKVTATTTGQGVSQAVTVDPNNTYTCLLYTSPSPRD